MIATFSYYTQILAAATNFFSRVCITIESKRERERERERKRERERENYHLMKLLYYHKISI